MGRPSAYTPEIAAIICTRLATPETLRSICKDEGMPSTSMVMRWLEEYPEFREQYARAREAQADAMADEILEIADTADADNVCDEYGNVKPNHEYIQRSKLRVDARKWLLSKMMPKKYGDKVEQTVIGDPAKPVHHKHEIDYAKATAEQLMEIVRGQASGER